MRLIQAAERGPVVQGMTGPDRLYVLTLGTGFRASELASLTPERFDLADGRPTATVPAAYTKNGREAVQPLPTDPTAAGIPYETDSGVADFHRLRGVCVSNLVSSGASVKTCQVLARHSSPILTIGIYAKASLHDIAGAVDALPDLTAHRLAPESRAATGTNGRPIRNLRAHPLPIGGDGTGRFGSEAGDSAPEMLDDRNPLNCRVLSLSDGARREEAPGGFEPPVEVLQTSALPLGYGAGREEKSLTSRAPSRKAGFDRGPSVPRGVPDFSGSSGGAGRRSDLVSRRKRPRPRANRLPITAHNRSGNPSTPRIRWHTQFHVRRGIDLDSIHVTV